MSRPSDNDVLNRGKLASMSPFEIPVTKEAIQRRIEKGDISQADVDILKRAYLRMTFSSLVGGAISLPMFFAMKRRRPPLSLGTRLMAASGMGFLGTFLGFAVGGAAAALEVNTSMEDSTRKLEVFRQITLDSTRALQEDRMKRRSGVFQPSISTSKSTSSWGDPSSDLEITEPQIRDLDFPSQQAEIFEDSDSSVSAIPFEGVRRRQDRGDLNSEIGKRTEGTWDRIRRNELPKLRTGTGAGGVGVGVARSRGEGKEGQFMGMGGGVDERSEEQRKFDALLEEERRGVAEGDVWK